MVMRPVLLRYGVPGLAVGLALVLQLLLVPWFGADPDTTSFLLFFAALIVAAWFGGLRPGFVATVLSALTSNYFFLYPEHSLEIVSFGQGLRLAVFSIEGVFISCLLSITHSVRKRAEEAQRGLKYPFGVRGKACRIRGFCRSLRRVGSLLGGGKPVPARKHWPNALITVR
jgi:hypothetical protein